MRLGVRRKAQKSSDECSVASAVVKLDARERSEFVRSQQGND
jgi:hypothetical protein